MNAPGSPYLPFDPNTRTPKEAPPPNSCDSQFHISGEGYKTRPGATYHSAGATYEAARKMHKALGIDRGIIVQSTVYATDHTIVLDALKALGPNYKAIGVIDDTLSDAHLADLKKAGVCGVRFSFGKRLNLIPSPELFARSAARCKELGWVLKINLPEEGLSPLVDTIKGLKDQPVVVDHMARVRGTSDPNLNKMCDLLRQGNVWLMMSNGHRVSTRPHFDEAVGVGKEYIKTNSDRLIWGSDWPHPLHDEYMPNDADLLELFYRYTDDAATRRKILVDNAARLFGFAA
jgi:predicted TIM-barrel fold metal-dependent hydrolase